MQLQVGTIQAASLPQDCPEPAGVLVGCSLCSGAVCWVFARVAADVGSKRGGGGDQEGRASRASCDDESLCSCMQTTESKTR